MIELVSDVMKLLHQQIIYISGIIKVINLKLNLTFFEFLFYSLRLEVNMVQQYIIIISIIRNVKQYASATK